MPDKQKTLPPADAPSSSEKLPTTKSIQAALTYLLANDPKSFDHLVGICWKACKGLFLTDPHDSYLVQNTPAEGHKNRKSYRENNKSSISREWIQAWLLEFLLPYRSATPRELEEHTNEFRYIGRKCRFALLDELNSTKRTQNRGITIRVSGNQSCSKENPDGSELFDFLVREDGSTSSRPVEQWVETNKEDLHALGLYYGAAAYVEAYKYGRKTDVSKLLAEHLRVSRRSGRSARDKFLANIQKLRHHKLVRQFYAEIEADCGYRPPVLAIESSADTNFRRGCAQQAAQLMADFYREMGTSHETQKLIEEDEKERKNADSLVSSERSWG
jgi:hypothetical protein